MLHDKSIRDKKKSVKSACKSKKPVKAAESYGWVVEDWEAAEAYEFAINSGWWDEASLNDEIVNCISGEELASCLAYIFRMNDFQEWNERNEDSDEDEDIEESVRAKGRKSVKASRKTNRRPVKASKLRRGKNKKAVTAAKLTVSFDEFKPWSGAVDTWNNLMDFGKIDLLEQIIDDTYYNEQAGEAILSETELNDLLWFEPETVYEWVGLYYNDETGEVSDEPFDDEIEESVRAKGRKSVKASRKINRKPVKASARKRRSVKASIGKNGTVTLKDTNTDVMPVVDFGCYGGPLSVELEDVFVADATDIESWDPSDEYYDEVVQLINEDYNGVPEFFEQVLSYAPGTIQDAFNEYGIPATVVSGSCKWDHPSYYNYSDDAIVFDMTIDANWVENKFRELNNDSEFVDFLNKNYSSRDGFISFMPNNTGEYEELLNPNDSNYWKLVSAIVTYMVYSDPSIREEVTTDLEESLRENANYTTFSGLGVY